MAKKTYRKKTTAKGRSNKGRTSYKKNTKRKPKQHSKAVMRGYVQAVLAGREENE